MVEPLAEIESRHSRRPGGRGGNCPSKECDLSQYENILHIPVGRSRLWEPGKAGSLASLVARIGLDLRGTPSLRNGVLPKFAIQGRRPFCVRHPNGDLSFGWPDKVISYQDSCQLSSCILGHGQVAT